MWSCAFEKPFRVYTSVGKSAHLYSAKKEESVSENLIEQSSDWEKKRKLIELM